MNAFLLQLVILRRSGGRKKRKGGRGGKKGGREEGEGKKGSRRLGIWKSERKKGRKNGKKIFFFFWKIEMSNREKELTFFSLLFLLFQKRNFVSFPKIFYGFFPFPPPPPPPSTYF